MPFSPESIAISVSSYALIMIASFIKFYLSTRKKNDISALIIPFGSGSTTLCKTFIEEYTHQTDVYLLDLEDRVMQSSKISVDEKTELVELKRGADPILYESKLMVCCNVVLTDILSALKTAKNRKIVVMVSTPNIADYLGLKKQIFLNAQGKLQKEIMSTYTNPLLIAYARSQLDNVKKKNTLPYQCFDDLLQIIEEKYKVKKNLK